MSKNLPEYLFDLLRDSLIHRPEVNAAVFNTLRILKKQNPGDTYLEAYRGHYEKWKHDFIDYYHLLWTIGSVVKPARVMEIGCRTGISICQLLSACLDPGNVKVHLFDLFGDSFISPELVKLNLKTLNIPLDNIEFVIGDSTETVSAFIQEGAEPMDYILVDGCHDKPVAAFDLAAVQPLTKPGTILLFDDISPDGCNLQDVWTDFCKNHAEEYYFVMSLAGKGIGVGVKR